MNRKDFQELSKFRLKEAKALLDLGHFDGAYYLAGYAVECALKACIAKGTQRHDFPDKRRVDLSHTHNLKELVRVAGLEAAFDSACNNREFSKKWEYVRGWSEQSRYQRHGEESARALILAVGDLNQGVIACIKPHY